MDLEVTCIEFRKQRNEAISFVFVVFFFFLKIAIIVAKCVEFTLNLQHQNHFTSRIVDGINRMRLRSCFVTVVFIR